MALTDCVLDMCLFTLYTTCDIVQKLFYYICVWIGEREEEVRFQWLRNPRNGNHKITQKRIKTAKRTNYGEVCVFVEEKNL